jgi:eukaryotic translation initiation factor 2C
LQQILHHQLLAIREAFIKLEKDYQPGITFHRGAEEAP